MRARAFAIVLFAAAVAHADEADDLITKGVELRERGKDEEALELFKKAYAKTPSPRARAQVALAEQALGMWLAAERDLTAALAAASDPWIAKHRAPLEGALATIKSRLGDLEVRGTQGEAEVYIDGVRLGTAPGPFRVEAGMRTLEVRARGFVSTKRSVEIPRGGIARETVTLVPETKDAEEPRTAPAADVPSTTSKVETSSVQPTVGWTLVATGGAALAFGVVALLVRQGIVDDYNASTCPGLGAAQPPACEDQVSSANSWRTISIVSFAAGGILAATGGILVLTSPKEPSRVACGPTLVGAGCGGTF